MARVINQKMNLGLFKKELCSVYMFLLTFLNAAVNTHVTVNDNNHGFIQSNTNDVRLMGVQDGLQVLIHQDVPISNLHEDLRQDDDAFATSTYVKFVPPQLDFKERYMGVPHLEKVMLFNTDPNRTVHLSSVSGNTLHFHSSFFQDKTIPPKGNTSFAVVLLARTEGPMTSSLYIHTSEGTFRYKVSGEGVQSPYRLQPLGGVRLPLHAVFQPLVWLHNPHHYPIQVVEVFSSGSEFHLELPGGELEGPKALWEVPPLTSKPVIRAKFEAHAHSNHTAYIRMKLNNSEEVLVIPVEVEVMDQGGLYSSVPTLDFGLGGSDDPPRSLQLHLFNSLNRALRVVSVGLVNPSRAVQVDFQPVRVPPGDSPTPVATLTYDWKAGFQQKHFSGQLWVKTRGNSSKLIVPYTATVLEGGLKIDPKTTQLLTKDLGQLPRMLTVKNDFRVPVGIKNATLLPEAAKLFQIKRFKPTIIGPGKSVGILTFQLKDECNEKCQSQQIDSFLILSTNVSDVTIPVRSYDGRFTLIFPYDNVEEGVIDLGLLSAGTVQTFRFGLYNHNPVPNQVKAVTTSSLTVVPRVLGVFNGNVSMFRTSYLHGAISELKPIPPGGIGIVHLSAHLNNWERGLVVELAIGTDFDLFFLPVKATVAVGTLDIVPRNLLLDDCFPGKVCRHELKVQSSFNRPITAIGVTTVPPDPRLTFKGNPGGMDILPSTSNYLGELTWEPWRGCGSSCYLGLPLNSTGGTQWVYTNVLPSSTADSDSSLLRERYQRLVNMTNGKDPEYWEHITLRLHTNELREQVFQAIVRLTWPRLANTTALRFPLTQATNTTLLRLKLYNPASHLILVQLVMEWAYPQAKRLIDSFPASFRPSCGKDCFQSTPKEFFIFQDFSDSAQKLGVLNTTLAPGESYEITIGYNPQIAGMSRSLLFIRNNLTIIEVVELEGRVSHAQLKFGNRRPGADNPLVFEIAEKHLRDCLREQSKKFPAPNLTVKRSFTARNVGDLPIYVHGFFINGLECEGYGFAVLNCEPFSLPPNGTKKVDIAFTPDFTLSKVTRTLRLATTLGADVNYTMVTTVPPSFLGACATVLARPSWEPLLYYSSVSFMLFLLFCVLAAAFFESDRILKHALLTLNKDRTAATPLDLRQVGNGVLKELSSQQLQSRRKSDAEPDGTERLKVKDPTPINVSDSPGWITGLSADDRMFDQKDNHQSRHDTDTETSSLNHNQKPKKKLGKRFSDADAQDAVITGKKKEKSNTSNGWCNVFGRSTEKVKGKAPVVEAINVETVKPFKQAPEQKKDDIKREEKDKRRGKVRRSKEAEEETSSTMTDSSNDTEKESKDEKNIVKENKEDKKQKLPKPKPKEEPTEDKSVHSRTIWRMNTKQVGKPLTADPIAIWKQPDPEPESIRSPEVNKSRGKSSAVRERKEKYLARRFDVGLPSGVIGADTNCQQPVSSAACWEQRSFSDVVAKDTPLLYSNIVQSKPANSQLFTDAKLEPSAQLGPIGSKKPTTSWNGNTWMNQSDVYGFPGARYVEETENDAILENEDVLPLDPEDSWEDQNDIMQMMHANSQPTWKGPENWPDSVWSPSRGDLTPEFGTELQEPSWGSLLRASWSPMQWTPRVEPQEFTPQPQEFTPQQYQPAGSMLFSQQPISEEENPLENGAPFDPFHSLGNIWSPKAPATWAAPGTQ